jgi:hypothetical protein
MYINTQTKQYPVSESEIRSAFPNTSFPVPFQAPEQYSVVFTAPKPEYDRIIRSCIEDTPELTSKGTWQQTWKIIPAFTEYTDEEGVVHTVQEQEAAAIAKDTAEKMQAIQSEIIDQVQKRLDDFATTRYYNSILSACTYATSVVPRFKSDGQYCVNARDMTWGKLYELLDDVQSGKRPMPTGYAEIEAELPVLEWP